MTQPLATRDQTEPGPVQPLGPTDLTWQYFGLWLGFAYGSVPQLYQLMHPVLGRAVDEHSNFREDPFDRLIRSMGPIYGVIYDGPDAERTAITVRGFHEHIKGVMPDGQRYSGLNPEVFFWAHATFVDGLIYGFSRILGPFSRAEQEQMYAQSLRWYRLYGMSMTDVPLTLDEFDAYWDHYIQDVLEPTSAAHDLVAIFRHVPPPPGFTWIPGPIWRMTLGPALSHLGVLALTAMVPPVIRARMGLTWNAARRLEYALVLRMLRALNRLTPPQYRYHPRPLAGWKREADARGLRVRELIEQNAR
jgi:uncharacterized protein (DUF2236 family)